MTIEFEEQDLDARAPDPSAGGEWRPVSLRWRRDPLTGASARIISGVKLQPEQRTDLGELTAPPPFCPFDADKIETVTFPFPPEIAPEGRFRHGKAVVVPNLMAYATYSTVCVYDPGHHFLDLDQLTPELIGDALTAVLQHAAAVRRVDPAAAWASVNANYLPPSGASLIHPHLQSAHDSRGLTTQRVLVERSRAWAADGASYWAQLVEEESGGPRWVGSTGRVSWLTPFAPSGFDEVWGVVRGARDLVDLTEDDCQSIGTGLSRILAAYLASNLCSFNFAITGGGPSPDGSYDVVVRIVSRSNPDPAYRSDVTYFELLHREALLDRSPEEVAAQVRPHFA